ncbi:hypothetical protein X801_10236, partial [Opisthorchis viverrini]
MWYDEIKLHDFRGEFNEKSGHFTQLIWKSTVKAGFGVASTKDGHQVFVVGRYMPPGNMLGEFFKNVPPVLTAGAAQFNPKHILPTRPRPKIIMHGNFRRKRERHTAPSIAILRFLLTRGTSPRFLVILCDHCLLEIKIGNVLVFLGEKVHLVQNGLFTAQRKSHSSPICHYFAKTSTDASM